MWFIFLLHQVVPEYPVILAPNCGELLDRPGTVPAEVRPGVWAGLDPRAAGAWLGLNDQGRVVAVENWMCEA